MSENSKIRILYVTSTARIGGAERRALNLARFSDPSRVETSLLTLEEQGELIAEASAAGVPVTGWNVHSLFQPRMLARMRRFLLSERIDIVHPFGLRAELLVRGPASRSRTRVISSICSVDPWRRWYHTALDRATADGVTAWISNSEAGKQAAVAREKFEAGRIFVVPTGIPDRSPGGDAARSEAKNRLGLRAGEGPVLGVIANVREAKGYGDLIEAVENLRERWPGLVCLCAGRDDSQGKISAAIRRRGMEPQIRLLGFLKDASSVYEVADLAVLPSRWEGMPSALVEAMRAGLPSVATEVGGIPELIRSRQEGLLVPARDPGALAEAIGGLLSNPELRQSLGEAARRRYEALFRVEAMVNRTLEIQEKVHNLGKR